MTPRAIAGLAEIADGYDGFLVDQFGVLHDGARAFPGARDCLAALRARGKRVAIVSNSGKRAAPNAARLARLGFEPALYDAVLTSGELCRAHLAGLVARGHLAAGTSCWVIASDDDRSTLAGLPLGEAEMPEAAALLVILGAAPERRSREAHRADLRGLAARGVPALCANPDLRMYVAGGASWGPGALAEDYRALGGTVALLGKPDPAFFRAALAALGGTPPERALVIGDSLEHDIAGASAAGCAWLFVEGGVQAAGSGALLADFPGAGHVTPRLAWAPVGAG